MGRGVILLFWTICISLHVINGCQLQGVNPVFVRVTLNILDVDWGVIIYENQIIDITGVIDIVQNPGLNSGPYITGYISGTTFYLETNDIYRTYEENETEASFVVNAQLRCLDGTSITQVFQIDIQDTNNNSPEFLPSDQYDIAIATPLLPGFQITGCNHNIVVRDIDLTTSRIDFALSGSDLFEIEYDAESSTTAKEFVAVIKTSSFIRSLPEPLELTISATDVDATGDPPRTTFATVRISADSDAVLPEEPVFGQALYTATYTADDTIILDGPISLQQGYDEDVSFSLNEEYSTFFAIIRNGNDISLSVTTPLPADILTRQQLYLVIRADREFTSGATATIVVQLPEEISLQFELANYEGVIEDNTLTLSNLVLTQGYETADVTVSVSNDFFSASIQGNIITLSMQPLTQQIIDENTFLNLEVTARTERSAAITVVTLEIVKDDTVTPVFQNPVYIGSYDTEIGLSLGQIELTQGFDDTVEITLGGEYSTYFQLIRNGAISTLTVVSLPLEELGEQTIILTIQASKPRTVGATASIYISLPEEIRLAFQQASYEGSIVDNALQVPNLILTQGYENLAVAVTVSNEYFTASVQGNVITLTMGQLPDAIIQANSFFNLEVTATTSRSSASTVVTLEIIKDDITTPLFENPLYSGSYTTQDGLTLGQINIVQGYDDTVDITLQGEHSNLFQLVRNGASSTVTGTVPPALFSQRNIALTVSATKPRTVGSSAVINIALPTDRLLEFDAPSYKGTYQNNILTFGVITLSTGYDDTVVFQLSDYNQYFQAINTLNQVSIQQLQPLPDSVVLENNFLALTLTASGLNALSASASLLIEIIKDDISTPVFSQNIYSGAYDGGSVVIQNINLIQGFDSSVSFRLDGADAQYFSLNQEQNTVTLSLSSPIPEEVIFDQKTLSFSILADKSLTVGANAAILITFPSELTDLAVMRFSQNTYIGSLEDGNLLVESMALNTGYVQGTQFFLTGDYSSYFTLSDTNGVLSIISSNPLPQEVIEGNKFIVLEVEARRDRAVSVFSSVIIELIHDETVVDVPVFNAAYYRGSYDLDAGLQFTEQIYLLQGYDDTVTFELQGEHSELFSVSDNNNVITLSASAIPDNVWENNDQLIFSLVANKPDSQNGQAAIVIDMPKETLETIVLGFERNYYVGSLANENLNLDAITLAEGYSEDVSFNLQGELQSYFTLSRNGATVNLLLSNAIPEDSLPSNGIIVLEIQASKTDALPAVSTVILEVVKETTPDADNLIFERTYYVGTYTTTDGLTFENTISLVQGYDDSVQFTLEGDDSNYFSIVQTANAATLNVVTAIPPTVIANNNQLIFVVNAQSSSGATARATVVITLTNEISDIVLLGFERTSYLGSIENEVVTLDPITLTEGYTADVTFTLYGDLQNYFSLSRNGATVTLLMTNAIPDNLIPTNGIIILEVQASTNTVSLPAVTTVILEVVRDTTPNVEELVFAQTYYLGTYTTTEGLTFDNVISLAQGYDESVQFTLDGDNSSFFTITQTGNSASLTLQSEIPPAVIAINNQLVFVVNAQSSGGANAQATIVISLPNEISENVILGFERISYQGSINNAIITLDPITLSEGYTDDVIFTLYGELQNYFTLSQNGATINLILSDTVPEEILQTTGVIILEIQASTTTNSLPAFTTIVLEVIRETPPQVEELVFAETYYLGTYTTTEGLNFDNTISLTQGYDESVQFTLDGDDSSYFTITQTGNSASLTMPTAIPPAVIANNNQLVFVINAQSSGGANARATIVISLPNEISNSVILGFERTSYQGTINNELITLDPINLSEGYSADVIFSLHGELQSYFTLSQNGATVTLLLSNAIPEALLPTNGIIVLDVQASTSTGALPAVTTIVLDVARDTAPNVELLFTQTYYLGTYTTTEGLMFENVISLAQGYDESVQFTLDSDGSSYFTITQTGNAASLVLHTAIPPAVIANNNQLVFVVNAQSSGGANARAAIVISLPNEISDNVILGFERTNYQGSIINELITLDPITLSEGYTADVIFTLHGELQSYFTLSQNGATVTLLLSNAIPEALLPTNGIIVLEVQASTSTGSLPAVTTVILEVIRETTPTVELQFTQTYYLGTYTTTEGLTFEDVISLAQGYDESVQFTLDGDDSSYFTITQIGNSVLLTLQSAIPPAVIANNNQFVFVVNAQSSGGTNSRATIVISLPNEISDSVILGFERTSYQGTINNVLITLDPITLSEGYTADVIFTLHGELQNYFSLSRNGATLNLMLANTIPEETLISTGVIVLEIQASFGTDSLPAVTTIILEVIRETAPEVEDLIFAQTYYLGTYTTAEGLMFDNSISLTQGYDETVMFTLVGDGSSYFTITQTGNSASLAMLTAIPPAVIANNNQLVFVVSAQSSGGTNAQATIVISLPNEISDSVILGFERTSYQGSINNELITLDPIILSEGFTTDVIFTLHGELQSYFSLSQNGATVTLLLSNTIPEAIVPTNGIIVLEIQASTSTGALPAVTTIILDVVRDTAPNVELLFTQTYYLGTYTTTEGLMFENVISLAQGYDESIQFTLDGDDSSYFTITQIGNSASLTMQSAIPPAVIANNNQLVFAVNAQSLGGANSRATIIISLPNEISDSAILGFERTSYQGTINNELITLDPITLSEGYTVDVIFTLHGEYQNFFTLSRNGATLNLVLSNAIPEETLLSTGVIVLEIQASLGTDSLPAVTTIILEVIRETAPEVEDLIFAQTYYLGTYTTIEGLTFDNSISLTQGYDENVMFTLVGDDSSYFTITQTGNSASVAMLTAIPPAVIANNNQLVFVVSAQSSGGANAHATIVISLPNEISDNVILGFQRTSYLGSINNELITLDPITLSEGYTADVIFTLHGELQTYFTLSQNGATVTLLLSNAIPEAIVPSSGIIVLEVQASSSTGSLPAVTTVILEVIRDTTPNVEELVFAQTYYLGTYTTTEGLYFENTISLAQGYHETVQFSLDGDDSLYFTITQGGNSATLILQSAIPPAVIANNNQLVFVVNAQSLGGANARATIVVSLPNEISNSDILGFERTSYQGSINNAVITLDPITLSEGYTTDVVFTLHGEQQNHFILSRNGATVILLLSNIIPEDSIPENGIIVLEVQASTPTDALPAVTTIILEVVKDTSPDVENLVFSQTYYIGTYTTVDGLSLDSTISLAEGYDDNVLFTLQGDDATYFGTSQSGNSLTLTLSTAIPPAVIANNNQLIFIINAQSASGATAQATVIITLPNEISDSVILGFERTSYLGSLNDEAVTLDPITLSEGYSDAVVFSLVGDLQSYFNLLRNEATVTLQLSNTIPEDAMPTNGIIILEIQASTTTDALPAVTTIILEVIRDTSPDVVDLEFSQTYYVGTYTTSDGLSLDSPISLAEGYDDNVQFTLQGDVATYFGISQSGNSLTLTLSTAIPPAVIANNNQLIFVINAQSASGATAQATIIITLPNEISDSVILGFERTSYLGSLNDEAITLDPITLSEGYSDAVVFSLVGDLQSYFALLRNGATVTLQLSNTIPEDSIPTNGIIILEIQAATTTDALPAVTTIVLEVIRDTSPDTENLMFSQTYYVGTYTTADGLSLDSTMSLAEGYDDNVQFTLQGDDAIYFGISQSGNSMTLTLSTAIPPAVLANNNQLIFVINAQSSSEATTQATIIITLPNEVSDSVILGFERTSYIGSINNEAITLDPITLSEGYSNDVDFTLVGGLQSHFTLSRNGATVTLQLSSVIPEDSIPANGIIVLEVQAFTTTDALPAVTTIILEVIRDSSPDVGDLVFSQTYYVGTYTTTDGLYLDSTILLMEGYDDNVQFTLQGDDANYFGISQSGNSLTLTLSTAIPPAVIANNNQLIFVINAQSANGATTQATIIITLPNEFSDSVILGFERTSYLGSLNDEAVTLDPITLSEGYSDAVVFSLVGDLQSYFALLRNGATVTLQLSNTIPGDSIPTNGIIILEIQAATITDALPAVTTIVLEVIRDTLPDNENLMFSQTYYVGTYTTADGLSLDSIISLADGYDDNVQFTLQGDDATYFGISQSGNSMTLTLSTAIPPAVIANNNQLIFVINAQSSSEATAQATIIITLSNEISDNVILGFERTNYLGSINNEAVTLDPITLSEGYSNDIVFTLVGDLQSYFVLSRNGATVTLLLSSAIPENLIPSNGIIVLEVQASTPTDALPAVTTIILEVISDTSPDVNLVFSQTYYVGTYTTTDGLSLESISLAEGYDNNVQFTLDGDNSIYFGILQAGNSLSLTLGTSIPPAVIANNNQLIFAINARSASGATAQATIVITLLNEISDSVILGFERTHYLGSINGEDVTLDPITLSEGYTESIIFTLHGELQNFFSLTLNGATVTLQLSNTIPEDSMPGNGIIILEIQASTTTDALPAVTTIILETIRNTAPDVGSIMFAQTYYFGTYTATDGLSLENIISLAEGYVDNVIFYLDGDDSRHFMIVQTGNSLTLTLITPIPPAVAANYNQLIFVINAQSNGVTASATIIINLPNEYTERDILGFERISYLGSITNEAVDIESITLTEGYTAEVTFSLYGELESYFELSRNGATITVQLQSAIPEDLVPANGIIILGVQASAADSLPAVATIVLQVERSDGGPTVVFSKVLYEGLMQAGTVQHEAITVTGHDETTTAEIRGVYSELFSVSLLGGVVTVQTTGSVALPTDVAHVAVEIHVGDAAAVLLLQVFHTDTPNPPPTVTFSPSGYVIRAEVLQTGVIGRVAATADNGESLAYSVVVEDAHLAARLSVNSNGELTLSSPANSGEYLFQVVATTLITQATGSATVQLTVDVNSIILPPLIVLDREEEEAHDNLVELSSSEYAGCSYTITNRFPANQDWLFVNETGLHARAIDREDPSIAFMALSQIQIELELHCNSLTRNKRSLRESRLDWLGPYDYGTSNWILGESIQHNPTKSVVNLIVNDINDNAPIFVGKENEPIAVGYPVPELEDVVLPRALAELQATDADVGENAALLYWSAEPELAVSPASGSVHVRDDVTLEQDQELVVHATDRNGQGLSASINLVVKLLDETNIAVVTIRNAFLEDEGNILTNLTSFVGYEVKVLRSVVISDETESIQENNLRNKRQTTGSGASLELYVYGLVQREPIAVDVLTEDLNTNAVGAISIASTKSLREYLEARQISSGHDIGLLVSTIVLSILLFSLIVAILIWWFLKWRKERNYNEFSDENSLESRNESIGQSPKVQDIRLKPRIDIDELKRSERRLQEMIDAPFNEIVTPTTSTKAPVESIIDISQPDPNILVPIVINDKLKDADEDPSDVDEFGEVRPPRRKSVVTFNENVERIIHVDDNVEGSSTSSDIEVFRF